VYEENKVCFERRTVSGSPRLVKLNLRCKAVTWSWAGGLQRHLRQNTGITSREFPRCHIWHFQNKR